MVSLRNGIGEKDLLQQSMKRLNNIYEQIYSIDNLNLADQNARKGKRGQYGVQVHDKKRETNILLLHEMLKNKTYTTSAYTIFKVYEPKEREVYRLPYFPDRIAHHAIMNVLKPIFTPTFTTDTYSCIEGKGIHAMVDKLKEALRDPIATKYCLKLDLKKFYHNIDHPILKTLLRRKLKDKDALWLLDGIIDSAPGLPIGNYLSQPLSTFYLTYFDHWIKEKMSVQKYFRYADDIVILAATKEELHRLLAEIRKYFSEKLKLEIKGNYQIFAMEDRGIDVLGYVFFHGGVTYIRKKIKKAFIRMMAHRRNHASIAAYSGWFKHGNCKHLQKKYLNERV